MCGCLVIDLLGTLSVNFDKEGLFMSQKNILKHFTVIGLGTIINLFLGLLSTPVITRIVDPHEYGQFSMFSTYSGIMVMVICIGLDQSLVRYYYENDGIVYKRALLYKCLILPVILSFIISAIVCFFAWTDIISFEFDNIILLFLCIYSIIKLIYRFSQLIVRLEYKSKLFSTLNIISKAVYIFAAYILLMTYKGSHVMSLVLALMLESVLCLVISIMAQKNTWNFGRINPDDCPFTIKELCTYGYPFIFSMGLMTFFQAIDKMSLNAFRSYSEVGIYASTNTLMSLFAVVQTTFNALWAPLSLEHYSKDKEDITFYQKGNRIITIIMFGIGLTMILCKDVFALLLGEKYRESAYILPFLTFHPIMYTISETTVSGIVFAKKSKAHIWITLVACITNLLGNTILVPKIGCQGAALSTGISYIVFFTMRTIISNKYFFIDFGLKKFYILTFLTSIYALYNSFISFNIGSVIGYLICIAFLCLMYWSDVKWSWQYLKRELLTIVMKKHKAQF